MMENTAFVAVTLLLGCVAGLPYVWLSWRNKISPDLPNYIAIVVSVSALVGGGRSAWIMLVYSLTAPEKLGIIQGNDVVLLGVGILCLIWISAQQAVKIYKPLLPRNGSPQ